MFNPISICRHWHVTWLDSHRCCCTECGRIGRWYEEGFVVWRKRSRVCSRPRAHAEPARLLATARIKALNRSRGSHESRASVGRPGPFAAPPSIVNVRDGEPAFGTEAPCGFGRYFLTIVR
jgi:hypothetical protein